MFSLWLCHSRQKLWLEIARTEIFDWDNSSGRQTLVLRKRRCYKNLAVPTKLKKITDFVEVRWNVIWFFGSASEETLMKGSYVWLMFQLCASTLSQRKKMQMNIFQLKSRSSKRQWYIRPNRRERLGQSRNNLLRSLIFKGFSFEWDEVHCSDEDDECKQKKKTRYLMSFPTAGASHSTSDIYWCLTSPFSYFPFTPPSLPPPFWVVGFRCPHHPLKLRTTT